MSEEFENELLLTEEELQELQDTIDNLDIDYEKLYDVMQSIGEERAELEKSLTEEELDIIDTAEKIEGLCNEILAERFENAKSLDEMTEEEAVEFYKSLSENSSKFIEALNLKSVTVEDIANDKLNDERDD